MTNLMNNLTLETSLPNLANVDIPRLCISDQIYYVDYTTKMAETVLEEFANSIESVCEARTRSYLPNETIKKLVRVTFLPKIGSLPIVKGIACVHGVEIKPIFIPDHLFFMLNLPKTQEIPESVLKHIRHVLVKDDKKMIIEVTSKRSYFENTIHELSEKYKVEKSSIGFYSTLM